ncbi:MAG: hypothetical protein WKF58_09660 [Ilumatobacteraceae bacterium]
MSVPVARRLRWRGQHGDAGPLEAVVLMPAILLLFALIVAGRSHDDRERRRRARSLRRRSGGGQCAVAGWSRRPCERGGRGVARRLGG